MDSATYKITFYNEREDVSLRAGVLNSMMILSMAIIRDCHISNYWV